MASETPRAGSPTGAAEERLREMNEALLVSSIRQNELLEKAQEAEASLRKTEAELRARLDELARFNSAAVGRELRIIELKTKLNNVAREHGEPEQYRRPDEEPSRIRDTVRHPPSAEYVAAASGGKIPPLESIVFTEALRERPARSPNYEVENQALRGLAHALAETPDSILQILAEKTLEVLQAGSAGISLLDDTEERFVWPAVAGAWREHIGGGTPRDFGPCGDVLDCNAPLLFRHVEKRYPYFLQVIPPVVEALLVPLYAHGKAIGTIWAVAHDEHEFDAEDLRQLESLGVFASGAYEAVNARNHERERDAATLNLMEDAVEARRFTEKLNVDLLESERLLREHSSSLAEMDRRKDEFLAMLSHELRNPLASILNAAHLLRFQQNRNPMQVEATALIDRQVAQLARLVDDLLEVSRISTGRIRLDLECVDLARIMHRAVATIHAQAAGKEQSVEQSVAGEPLWVRGDAVRLEQIAVNLLHNASKYTHRGGTISITLKAEGNEAVLRVRDNGVGIAPEMLPRIFDLFTQAESSLDRSQGGLGVGLALVQSLVVLHRGRVTAESALGRGSEFLVAFPLVPSPEGSRPPTVESTPSIEHTHTKVLVVDDNIDAGQSLSLLLQAAGHDTRVLHDATSVLPEALRYLPEVVLLDLGLPVLDGCELAKQIRREPTLRGVLLIAVTGYGQASDRLRTREAGFDHHLVKPVIFADIERVLADLSGKAATGAAS